MTKLKKSAKKPKSEEAAAKARRKVEEFEELAKERWQRIINFMLGLADPMSVNPEVKDMLVKSKLLTRDRGEIFTLSTNGFHYVLLDSASQAQHLLLHYIEQTSQEQHSLEDQANPVEILQFIFMLSLTEQNTVSPLVNLPRSTR